MLETDLINNRSEATYFVICHYYAIASLQRIKATVPTLFWSADPFLILQMFTDSHLTLWMGNLEGGVLYRLEWGLYIFLLRHWPPSSSLWRRRQPFRLFFSPPSHPFTVFLEHAKEVGRGGEGRHSKTPQNNPARHIHIWSPD